MLAGLWVPYFPVFDPIILPRPQKVVLLLTFFNSTIWQWFLFPARTLLEVSYNFLTSMFRNDTFASSCHSSCGDNQECGAQAPVTVVVLRDHLHPSRSSPSLYPAWLFCQLSLLLHCCLCSWWSKCRVRGSRIRADITRAYVGDGRLEVSQQAARKGAWGERSCTVGVRKMLWS